MKIIERKNLQYAKDMYVTKYREAIDQSNGPITLKEKQAEIRVENQIKEHNTRKEILKFVDQMMDLMLEVPGEYNSRDLKITFIFER